MSTLREERDRLEFTVRARKAQLRRASRGEDEPRDGERQETSAHQYLLKQVMEHPGAAAAVAFGVMSVFGPWRSVRLASKAFGAAAMVRKLTK